MAYVYRHIRLDKNVTFYIGIGCDVAGKHERAYSFNKHHRNKLWNRIAAKAGVGVEILVDEISWESACAKEMELISVYGRVNDGGILANITRGGEGAFGLIHSEESNRKNREAHLGKTAWNKGIPLTNEVKKKLSESKKGQKAWNRGIPMSDEARVKSSQSRKGKPIVHLIGRKNTSDEIARMVAKRIRTVYQFTLEGVFIREYSRAEEAANATGFKMSSIAACCRNMFGDRKTNKHGGFLWSYEKAPI